MASRVINSKLYFTCRLLKWSLVHNLPWCSVVYLKISKDLYCTRTAKLLFQYSAFSVLDFNGAISSAALKWSVSVFHVWWSGMRSFFHTGQKSIPHTWTSSISQVGGSWSLHTGMRQTWLGLPDRDSSKSFVTKWVSERWAIFKIKACWNLIHAQEPLTYVYSKVPCFCSCYVRACCCYLEVFLFWSL